MDSRDEAFEKWFKDQYSALTREQQAAIYTAARVSWEDSWNAALSAARKGIEIDGVAYRLTPVRPVEDQQEPNPHEKLRAEYRKLLTAAKEQTP